MSTAHTRKRPSRRQPAPSRGKPRGVLHPRVQQVGPEHFGIVCFDCHQGSSTFLLADFYGPVLLPPTPVAHNRPDLDAAVPQVRAACATHELRDGLVASERTGRYHRLVQRTFAAAGFETRMLHPFVTKHYRQGVDPAFKTDDTDRAAMHRATVTGCALLEATRDATWTALQLLLRHRRDLVRKGAARNCQIRDHREAALPGFAACFDKFWDSPLPWHQQKTQAIQALECEIAGRLAQTPYVVLLSFPGVKVVSAADFAGAAGPLEHYVNPKASTGRAG